MSPLFNRLKSNFLSPWFILHYIIYPSLQLNLICFTCHSSLAVLPSCLFFRRATFASTSGHSHLLFLPPVKLFPTVGMEGSFPAYRSHFHMSPLFIICPHLTSLPQKSLFFASQTLPVAETFDLA